MNNEDMSDIFKKINNVSGSNNISPEMVNNLINMINNSNGSNNKNFNDNTADNSSNQDKTSNNSNSDFQNNSFNNSSQIDMETIMRMKNIVDKMNIKDDPRSNLLQSLKPYLKESRKSKIDQYIQLMNMSKVMDVFPFIGGDKKNNG